jgi:type IV pilus assembly protein PilM
MLSFVKKWLGPRANPIGVDFGTDTLKVAQVAQVNGEWRLEAAASADVPSHVRQDVASRMNFFAEAIRDLVSQNGFVGRSVALALPAASMFIQHLRMPKMDEDATKKALSWEARGKLPIDPSHAILRHQIAGSVFQDQEEKNEVILMAAPRELVNQFLAAAGKARLEVVGMNVEPKAIVDCFSHIYRRKSDAEITNCFVDMGCGSTRVFVARGAHVLFARVIPIGGDHFTRAAAAAMNINFNEAKLLRLQLCNLQPAQTELAQKQQIHPEPQPAEGFAILGAALAAARREQRCEPRADTAGSLPDRASAAATRIDDTPATPGGNGNGNGKADYERAAAIELACRQPLDKLVEELDLCRRYHEATFANNPIQRLIFVGGEAKHKGMCQYVARQLGIAAQVGDPLVRMGRATQVNVINSVGLEGGLDRRQPQPNWAVAIGLSLGPNQADQPAAANGEKTN